MGAAFPARRLDGVIGDPVDPSTPATGMRLWVFAVALCAFGPYLVGGLRTEQLAVYGSAAAVLALGWPVWRRSRRGSAIAPFLLAWSAITAIALVGAIWVPLDMTLFPPGNPIAGLDNWMLPIAVIIVTAFWCERLDTRSVATVVCTVIVVAMLLNTVASFIARVNGDYTLMPWVDIFWTRGDEEGTAVATNALSNERYTGLFNQPTEAGICYSLALLSLAYLARLRRRNHAVLITVAAAVLIIGGVLAVSKVVLFGGVPLFFLFMLTDRVRRARFLLATGGVLAVVIAVAGSDLAKYVVGTIAFRTLFAESLDTTTLSGGRLGSGGTLATVADQVSASHPWFGLGAGGVAAPYDSSWIEAMATTGTVGSVLLGAVFLGLAIRWVALRPVQEAPESMLGLCVVILVAGASMGMPSLTGNKVSTLLWILLTCLLMTPRRRAPAPSHDFAAVR